MSARCVIQQGDTFGRWAVAGEGSSKSGRRHLTVICACGSVRDVDLQALKSGASKSCGCYRDDQTSSRRRTHGKSRARGSEYYLWMQMRSRCSNPKNKSYPYYGGRGIHVCSRWQGDFEAFLADVGPRPTAHHTLDRINNDGNYEPGNVRWATRSEQAFNRRPKGVLAHV